MTRALTAFLVVFAVSLAALPPGLWALCVDGRGHVAVEPADLDCHAGRDADSDCQSSCDSCEDYRIGGRVLRTKGPDLPAPTALPVAGGGFEPASLASPAHALAIPLTALPPRDTPLVLRC